MLYKYDEKMSSGMTVVLEDGRTLTGRFFDGMRIDPATMPEGSTWYQTRHNDDGDWSTPVSIVQQRCIAVNFCGTLISGDDIALTEETCIRQADIF